MRERWLSTVFSLRNSVAPISRLVLPAATSPATSRSRAAHSARPARGPPRARHLARPARGPAPGTPPHALPETAQLPRCGVRLTRRAAPPQRLLRALELED